MKYIDEYRDPVKAGEYLAAIKRITRGSWTLMEICGGQTHSIIRYGIDQMIPPEISLSHGPGCPVCVTPLEKIDKAIDIAGRPGVIFCTYGDMIRVPGSQQDLMSVKASGGDIRIVYSPLDALKIARENPDKIVVFFAIGFETTASVNAMAAYQARRLGVANFFLLVSQVLVPPAMRAVLSSDDVLVNGFLAAGHVCTVMGYHEYEPISRDFARPIVVTGFEPLDILQGIYMLVSLLEKGINRVDNQYRRTVTREGNLEAQKIIKEVFTVVDHKWRGIGEIAQSGWALSEEYRELDAEMKFGLSDLTREESSECLSGLVLRGIRKPDTCPAFAVKCTPDSPLGATMVSAEGACAVYFQYRAK
jgi:hydrogenase expression/formation protein HypD